jgi:fermentation-respiration switch protein FrsA (DUF1100 family)
MTRFLPLFVAFLAFTGMGCNTIPITEQDVFMPKPSVTPSTFDVEGVQLEEFALAVDDSVRLNAWHLTQPEARGTVLFFGGNGFYLVQSLGYIQALTAHPVNVVMFDYRGYGQSEGSPGVDAFKRDAEAAYRHVRDELGVSPRQILVHGHSLGTFLASYVGTTQEVGGIVLENPATNVNDWVKGLAPWYVRLFVSFEVDEDLQGESNLERLRAMGGTPLLTIAGAQDNITAPGMAQTLHDEADTTEKTLVVVEDGGHNQLYESTAYQDAYRQLLDRVLPPLDAFSVDED